MKQEAAQQIKSAAVAGGTLASGLGTILQYLPPILGCIATIFGIVASTFMIFKTYHDIRYSKADRRYKESLIKDLKERRNAGLSLERHTDKEMLNGEDKKGRR